MATTAADTRILDSRQFDSATQSLSTLTRYLFRRIPTSIQKRNSDSAVCKAGFIQGCVQGGGPAPGAVTGIVLGSIAGFLLLLWILWVLSNGTSFIRTTNLVEEDDVVISRRHRSRSPRGSRRSHRESATYQAEMRRTSPQRRGERRIVQERIRRDRPSPRVVESSRVRESTIVEETRVDGDDIVEVIEEHSSIGAPPPRRKSRRQSNNYN